MKKINSNVYSTYNAKKSNFIIFFGCKPSAGVDLKTKMVHDIAVIMESRFDPKTLSLHIPIVFDQLKSEDAQLEMVTSNLIQPMRLFYSENIISHTRAVIFVNEGIDRRDQVHEEQFIRDK